VSVFEMYEMAEDAARRVGLRPYLRESVSGPLGEFIGIRIEAERSDGRRVWSEFDLDIFDGDEHATRALLVHEWRSLRDYPAR